MWWIVVALGLGGAYLRLRSKRRPLDAGGVSEQWLAEHRADRQNVEPR